MKHALIKHLAGNVTVMHLIPQTLLMDEVEYKIEFMIRLNDTVRLTCTPSLVIEVSAALFDAGEAPDGGQFGYATVEESIAKWSLDRRSTVTSWRDLPYTFVPSDRTFREAWCDVTPEPVVDVDMEKAREIHRERLRQLRAPILVALDLEYMLADETGDAQAKRAIVAKKWVLRNVTSDPAIEAAQTPEQLRAVISEVLKG